MEEVKIPKIIHYCWFGNGEIPEQDKNYIEQWKKLCPDYIFMLWNEENFDVNNCSYTKQAASVAKWSFVTDYVRLFALYQYGGVYLDTDVEMIRRMDDLLCYDAFVGFENHSFVNNGSCLGATKHHPYLKELMTEYENTSFILEDGSFNLQESPRFMTELLVRHGMVANGKRQSLSLFEVFPSESFSPYDYKTGRIRITSNTYLIHHYHDTWHSAKERKIAKGMQLLRRVFGVEQGDAMIEAFFTRKDKIKERWKRNG